MTNAFDLRCPSCGSNTQIKVQAVVVVHVLDAVTPVGDIEWNDDSLCICDACGHPGKVIDFEEKTDAQD